MWNHAPEWLTCQQRVWVHGTFEVAFRINVWHLWWLIALQHRWIVLTNFLIFSDFDIYNLNLLFKFVPSKTLWLQKNFSYFLKLNFLVKIDKLILIKHRLFYFYDFGLLYLFFQACFSDFLFDFLFDIIFENIRMMNHINSKYFLALCFWFDFVCWLSFHFGWSCTAGGCVTHVSWYCWSCWPRLYHFWHNLFLSFFCLYVQLFNISFLWLNIVIGTFNQTFNQVILFNFWWFLLSSSCLFFKVRILWSNWFLVLKEGVLCWLNSFLIFQNIGLSLQFFHNYAFRVLHLNLLISNS